MKKRIIMIVCVLALLLGCVALSTMAASTKTGYCEACKKTVTWEPAVYGSVTDATKHYYVPADGVATQIIAGAGGHVCIDLNGKTLTSAKGRVFLAYQATESAPSSISIQDSVGGGTVISDSLNGTTNNGSGGVMWVDAYSTINVYGGTFNLKSQADTCRTSTGGIACVYPKGVLNIYGGTLNGSELGYSSTRRGGAIDVQGNGKLNIYGGTVTAGSNATYGNCINLRKNAVMTLSGDAKVEDIHMEPETLSTAMLTVTGSFTGRANLSYRSGVSLEVGTQVGKLAEGASLSDGSIYCANGLTAVADGTALKLAEPSTEDKRYECPKCKQTVTWEVFTTTAPSTSGTYHYYLNRSFGTAAAKQYHVKGGAQVCVDLNGFSFSTSGRSVYVDGKETTLTLLDTKGGGSLCGSTGNNNTGGGAVYVSSGAVFNLYSGTLKFNKIVSSSYMGVGRGGVIQSSGTVNIYGGKIQGGDLVVSNYDFGAINGYGGAIYNGGTLNIYGGEITSGTVPETGAAPCIYMAGSTTKVKLSGNAKVEDIYFNNATTSRLTVTGSFTGTANLSYDPGVVLEDQMPVGKLADGASMNGATVTCAGANVLAVGDQLVITSYDPGTVAATGGVGYPSLQAAIDAAEEGALVELLKSQGGQITVDKTVYLQLNGCRIAGTVTVAQGKTLYGMDSNTDDFTVADSKYGKIDKVEGNVTGAAAGDIAKDSYLMVTEDSGVSFHCVRLQIYAMTLRTDDADQPGLFYKSYFKADEKAAPMIATYGVALSIIGEPDGKNLETDCRYTEFEGFESGAMGNLGNSSSSLLTGILKNRYSQKVNTQNLSMPIYGRAYVKTADGQYLFGASVCRSLADQLTAIDGSLEGLSKLQTGTVTDLYAQFKSVLETKGLNNIAAASENHENGTLKVLVLGNSHGLDSTNLLAEVFCQERLAGNHDQDVLIAALYYGGCKVAQHHNFLQNNLQEYTYHKNYGTSTGEKWVVKDATCLDALQDEQWDIILMQQMNTNAGKESDYKAADWKFVAEYLLNNQDLKPTLGFHMTWANPDDYELFLNDDAPYNIRYISTYSDPASWRKNHENLFNTGAGKYEMEVMYDEIMRLTQKYLVDSTDWLGTDYFDERYIMNSATPIQYAQKVLGREQLDVYRDYTHMSDYGRLIVSYQWYAQLMGLDKITEVNTDVIPKGLKHKNSKYPTATDENGDYIVDAQMKADLIESVNWALKNPWNLPTE